MFIVPDRLKHLHLLWLYPLVGLGFVFCEHVVTRSVHVMDFPPIDHAIPFVPFMVWPYVLWYFFVAFPFFWYAFRDGPRFTRFTWFLYAGMSSTYVIYLLFWNGQDLRPSLAGLHGVDIDVIRWIYAHDSPQNVNPSIHVIDTMAVWFAFSRDPWFRKRPVVLSLVGMVCLGIIASTVFIKQHSVLDVTGGLIWSGLWYGAIYSRWSPFFRSGSVRTATTLSDQR